MSYDMGICNGMLCYQIRCDECNTRFTDPNEGGSWVVDGEQAEAQAKRTGWRICHEPSTGVLHHQRNRHKTLEHMGNAHITGNEE